MKPKIETKKGWTEVVIDDACGFEKFYRVAEVLQREFKLTFTNKLDHLDSLYWDFDYKECTLTLHYNIYAGVTLFPKAFKEATPADNGSAEEIGTLLFQELNQE